MPEFVTDNVFSDRTANMTQRQLDTARDANEASDYCAAVAARGERRPTFHATLRALDILNGRERNGAFK